MKTQIEKDIESTIRLLRFLTYGQDTSYLSIFDSGSFEEGTITAYLERDGMSINNKKFFDPENFKKFLLKAVNPFNFSEEELKNRYKKQKWNDK